MGDSKEYPRDYTHLVRDALIGAMPWIESCIVLGPGPGDCETELLIEVPPVHSTIKEPLIIDTHHDAEGKFAPVTELNWSIWNEDPVLTVVVPDEHIAGIVASLERFLSEGAAGYKAWLGYQLTSGGTVVPADSEPFPPGKADRIEVRSWKGSYDREIVGAWPGWPNDSKDPFYKDLQPSRASYATEVRPLT